MDSESPSDALVLRQASRPLPEIYEIQKAFSAKQVVLGHDSFETFLADKLSLTLGLVFSCELQSVESPKQRTRSVHFVIKDFLHF
jgi:hypothetical protein